METGSVLLLISPVGVVVLLLRLALNPLEEGPTRGLLRWETVLKRRIDGGLSHARHEHLLLLR